MEETRLAQRLQPELESTLQLIQRKKGGRNYPKLETIYVTEDSIKILLAALKNLS